MNNVKINADLTKSIEVICEKIGIASSEIVPYYMKAYFWNGIGKLSFGLLLITLPFCLFLFDVPIPTKFLTHDFITSAEGMEAFWLFVKVVPCFICVIKGLSYITGSLSKIFAPKGNAIQWLIRQIIK